MKHNVGGVVAMTAGLHSAKMTIKNVDLSSQESL